MRKCIHQERKVYPPHEANTNVINENFLKKTYSAQAICAQGRGGREGREVKGRGGRGKEEGEEENKRVARERDGRKDGCEK